MGKKKDKSMMSDRDWLAHCIRETLLDVKMVMDVGEEVGVKLTVAQAQGVLTVAQKTAGGV